MKSGFVPALACMAMAVVAARAETTFTVHQIGIADQKSVFATVESPYVVPARARIGGTVATLSVHQGDQVTQGQVIAVVADERLLLQINSLDAQIAGLKSQLDQANIDFSRADMLARSGAGTRATLDQAKTAVQVDEAAIRARTAERDVAQQTLDEGKVLAPVAGRVLTVPLTQGTVVLNGDPVATIGEQPFKLRLRLPERHAEFLKAGDPIRLAAGQPGAGKGADGTVTLVYPQIEEGRVVADATVSNLGDYFVGDRVLVWIGAGVRQGFVIPASYIVTRFGLDYVTLRQANGVTDVPVQRGEPHPTTDMPDGIEVLSGVHNDDVLVRP